MKQAPKTNAKTPAQRKATERARVRAAGGAEVSVKLSPEMRRRLDALRGPTETRKAAAERVLIAGMDAMAGDGG